MTLATELKQLRKLKRIRLIAPPPLKIAVGYELSRVATIHPQAHDIAMDFVVTETGIYALSGSALVLLCSQECRRRAQQLCTQRGLPRQRIEAETGYSSPPCYAGEFPGYFGEEPDKKK